MSNCFCRRNFCCDFDQDQRQAQAQAQLQLQAQTQKVKVEQDQDQDSEQEVKSIFKEIGNNSVNIEIDNVNVLVAVLVVLGYLTGSVDGTEISSLLASVRAGR